MKTRAEIAKNLADLTEIFDRKLRDAESVIVEQRERLRKLEKERPINERVLLIQAIIALTEALK